MQAVASDPALLVPALLLVGMASSDDGVRLESGKKWIEFGRDIGGFAGAFVFGLSGALAAVWGAAIALLEAGVNVPISILDAFAIGLPEWVFAFTRDPAQFLGGSFQIAAAQLQQAPWNTLGPFIPWLAAISAIGVVGIITWYLDRQESDVPGSGLDVPFVGNDEEDEGLDLPIVGNDEEED